MGQAHQALDRGRRAGNVLAAGLDLRLDEIKIFPSARVRRPFVSCRGEQKDLIAANKSSPGLPRLTERPAHAASQPWRSPVAICLCRLAGRRVGKESVSTCRSRGSPSTYKKKKQKSNK